MTMRSADGRLGDKKKISRQVWKKTKYYRIL
jgi:hypothetical protein